MNESTEIIGLSVPVLGSLEYCLLCEYWNEDLCKCPPLVSCPALEGGL